MSLRQFLESRRKEHLPDYPPDVRLFTLTPNGEFNFTPAEREPRSRVVMTLAALTVAAAAYCGVHTVAEVGHDVVQAIQEIRND